MALFGLTGADRRLTTPASGGGAGSRPEDRLTIASPLYGSPSWEGDCRICFRCSGSKTRPSRTS